MEELKAHPFFRSIDWDQLYMKEIPPPFVPNISRASDVSNVDPEFLAEAPEETPVQDSPLSALEREEEVQFDNFTFTKDSTLSDVNSSQVRAQTELQL